MKSEFELIERIKKRMPKSIRGPLGIGDDGDYFRCQVGEKIVVSTDSIVENVDFVFKKLAPKWVGRKCLAINISDMAAMGAQPHSFTVALGIPSYVSTKWLDGFYKGLFDLAKKYKIIFLGGDISRAKEFFATVTILGESYKNKILTRSEAKDSDFIGVTGKLGDTLTGHHYRFTPRIKEAMFLIKNFCPSSMIDISDGFYQDLCHILEMSKKGAKINLDKLPIKKSRGKNGDTVFEKALTDGEDFELLFTVSKKKRNKLEEVWNRHFPKVQLSWIGTIEKEEQGLKWYKKSKITKFNLGKKGYTHF